MCIISFDFSFFFLALSYLWSMLVREMCVVPSSTCVCMHTCARGPRPSCTVYHQCRLDGPETINFQQIKITTSHTTMDKLLN